MEHHVYLPSPCLGYLRMPLREISVDPRGNTSPCTCSVVCSQKFAVSVPSYLRGFSSFFLAIAKTRQNLISLKHCAKRSERKSPSAVESLASRPSGPTVLHQKASRSKLVYFRASSRCSMRPASQTRRRYFPKRHSARAETHLRVGKGAGIGCPESAVLRRLVIHLWLRAHLQIIFVDFARCSNRLW